MKQESLDSLKVEEDLNLLFTSVSNLAVMPSSIHGRLLNLLHALMALFCRWELFKPVWESSNAALSQTPLSVPEALPLSVTNISRASQPVLMAPDELRVERDKFASGIFVAYHDKVDSRMIF